MFPIISQFILSACLVFVLGQRLTACGQRLSEKTGISSTIIGALFLSVATSVPEVVTSFAAVFAADSIPLAIGDFMGSVIVNIMALSAGALVLARPEILEKINSSNRTLLKNSFFQMSVMAMACFIPRAYASIGWIGVESFLIAFIYLSAVRALNHQEDQDTAPEKNSGSAAFLWMKFFVMLIAISILGYFITMICDELSRRTDMSRSFVGATFLAIATSLPEISVTIWALKMGHINMAFGNIIGSNAFNCFVYPMIDIVYAKGSIGLYATKANHMTIGIAAFLCGLLLLESSFRRQRKTLYRYTFHSFVIITALAGFGAIYYAGR